MLLSAFVDRRLRATYVADALGNVAWAMTLATMLAFALVIAREARAGTWLVSGSISLLFFPLLIAGAMPALCRRYSLGGVMIALRVLAGAALLACLVMPSLTTLILAFAAVVFALGLNDVVYPALFHVIYPPAYQVRVMGLLYTERALASLVLVMVFGRLLQGKSAEESIRILGMLGVLALLSAAAAWRFRRVREEPVPPSSANPRGASPFANRHFRWYLVAITFFGSGVIIQLVVWPMLIVNAFALGKQQVGLITAFAMAGQTAAFLAFSRFGRVSGSNRLLAVPYLLQAAMMTTSFLLLLHGGTTAFPFLLLAAAVGSVGSGLQNLLFFLVVNSMARGASALAYQATQNVVIGIRGVIMPFIAGALFEALGMTTTVAISALLVMAGAVLAALSPPAPEHSPTTMDAEAAVAAGE